MEPTRVSAGTTISWERILSDYSADDGYSAVYYLRNASHVLPSITCDGDGSTHTAVVTVATSAKWPAGKYQWTLFAEKSEDGEVTERHEIAHGEMDVLENASSATPHDGRTFAGRMVDALEALLLKLSNGDSTSLSLNTPGGSGRSKTYKSLEEVEASLSKWRSVVSAEQDAARARSGKRSRRISRVNFIG